LTSALLTYTRKKLEKKVKDNKSEGVENALTKYYKYVHFIIEVINFYLKANYMFNTETAKYYDIIQMITRSKSFMTERSRSQLGFMEDVLKNYPVFIVFVMFKFFEWFFRNRRSNTEVELNQKTENVKPPIMNEVNEINAEGKDEKRVKIGICPICSKGFENPAFVMTSQNVYCYKC